MSSSFQAREAGTPEMTSERPIGNKKAKEVLALEKKLARNKSSQQDGALAIAAALERRARVMEASADLELFQVKMDGLDEMQKRFTLARMQYAEIELQKKLKSVCENVSPNIPIVGDPLQSQKDSASC